MIIRALARGFFLFLVGTGTAALFLAGFQVAYYRFAPMNWWIDYRSATVIGQGPEASLFVNRVVKGKSLLPVRVYAELHGALHTPTQQDQYCEASYLVTAEPDTGPLVKVPIRDILRMGCRYDLIPCEPMTLQTVMEIELEYSVKKRRRFVSEPYYPSSQCDAYGRVNFAPQVPVVLTGARE